MDKIIKLKFVGFNVNINYKTKEIDIIDYQKWFYTMENDKYYLKSLINTTEPILSSFPVISLDNTIQDFTYPINRRSVAWQYYIIKQIKKDNYDYDDIALFINNIQHLSIYSLIYTKYRSKIETMCYNFYSFINNKNTIYNELLINIETDNNLMYSNLPTKDFTHLKFIKHQGDKLNFLTYLEEDYILCFVSANSFSYGDFNEFIHPDGSFKINIRIFSDYKIKKHPGDLWIIELDKSNRITNINVNKNPALLLAPNNSDERNSIGTMFRSEDLLLDLSVILGSAESGMSFCPWSEQNYTLTDAFLNDVFKYNYYHSENKSIFNYHYDTMFTNQSKMLFSVSSIVLYLEVKGEHYFVYKYKNIEYKFRIMPNTIMIIPHYLQHKVYGNDSREFVKTELCFNFTYQKDSFSYDKDLEKLFDSACNDLRYSLIFPELKKNVTEKFNLINKSRFYMKTILSSLTFTPVYISTTLITTLKTHHRKKIIYGSDYEYYYFKINEFNDDIKFLIKLLIIKDLYPMKHQIKVHNYCLTPINYLTHPLQLRVENNQLFSNKDDMLLTLQELPYLSVDETYYHPIIYEWCKIIFASCKCEPVDIKLYFETMTFNIDDSFELSNKILKVNKFSFKNGITFHHEDTKKFYYRYSNFPRSDFSLSDSSRSNSPLLYDNF